MPAPIRSGGRGFSLAWGGARRFVSRCPAGGFPRAAASVAPSKRQARRRVVRDTMSYGIQGRMGYHVVRASALRVVLLQQHSDLPQQQARARADRAAALRTDPRAVALAAAHQSPPCAWLRTSVGAAALARNARACAQIVNACRAAGAHVSTRSALAVPGSQFAAGCVAVGLLPPHARGRTRA